MKQYISIIFALLFATSSSWAQTKAQADSAYLNKDYAQAIEIYESLLQTGESGEIY